MDFASSLHSHLGLTLTFATILGLVIGSFLNVVIFRYPKMLKQEWKAECQALLKQPPARKPAKFNLMKPASKCPKCKKQIKPWNNIPLFSYLFLKGKCADCKVAISAMYPIVEILTAVLTLVIVYRFGLSLEALSALIFTWSLIVLSFIDFREHLLPDLITITVLWIGLLANSLGLFTTPEYAIFGAIIGYCLLWVIAKLFKLIRKKDGMGHGDFKMLAMLGAWLGVSMLLNVLITAVLIALVVSAILLGFKKISKKNPIPFGPYLALGGLLTMLFGPSVVDLIARMVT